MGFEAASHVLNVTPCMCESTMQLRHAYIIYNKLDHPCLPHKDGELSLSAFPKNTTSKIVGFFITLLFLVLNIKQESFEIFKKSFFYDPVED